MNISNINLNLLRVLDALLTECHVTRAGQRVHLSQAAISHSLKQLRTIFEDDLLVRGYSGKMTLTQKAISLKEPVKSVLQQIDQVFQPEEFDIKHYEGQFTIGISDYIGIVLLAKLFPLLHKHAPKLQLVIKNADEKNYMQLMNEGDIDLAIGCFTTTTDKFIQQRLFTDECICVGRQYHPALSKTDKIDFKTFMSYPSILITFTGNPSLDVSQKVIEKLGEKRKASLVTPFSSTAIRVIEKTDCICITFRKLIDQLAGKYKFCNTPVPFKLPTPVITQVWDKKNHTFQLHQWIRQQVKYVTEE